MEKVDVPKYLNSIDPPTNKPVEEWTDDELANCLENHVISRLPGTKPIIENGAWAMMLEAAVRIRRLLLRKEEKNGY